MAKNTQNKIGFLGEDYQYKLVHEYTFTHFKDEVYGEWYGYLRRDGSISTDLKGNIFKGPFHIPRCELENILQIKEILNK